MKAPNQIATARLLLRKPTAEDAEAIFSRYASDAEVTKYLSWPRHRTLEDTKWFLKFSDAEWESQPAGPYIIEAKTGGQLVGSTGLAFESDSVAQTGYVFARDAWGRGYATEALTAMTELARELGVRELYAFCHALHPASAHVLDKCGFRREALLERHTEFPNLGSNQREDCLRYALLLLSAVSQELSSSRSFLAHWCSPGRLTPPESVEAAHSIHRHPLRDADGRVPPVLGQTQLSHQSPRRAFRRTDPRLLGAYSSLFG
jgi:ribosomal-protein-alanine N-acetyltransferase